MQVNNVTRVPPPSRTLDPASQAEDAVINTLETVLPDAARRVEEASREILKNFMRISEGVAQQEELMKEMMHQFTMVHTNGTPMSLNDFIAFITSTTVLAVERNLLFSHYGHIGSKNMAAIVDKISRLATLLEKTEKEERKPSFEKSVADMHEVIHELNLMRDRMSEVTLSKSEREICAKDLEALNNISLAAPERDRTFNAIAASAMRCSQNINTACAQTIAQMQFQDKNTQTADNLREMLQVYKQLCLADKNITITTENLSKIYEKIRLEDIRRVFLSALNNAGPESASVENPEVDDIELF